MISGLCLSDTYFGIADVALDYFSVLNHCGITALFALLVGSDFYTLT
jgi:hypothetical protein